MTKLPREYVKRLQNEVAAMRESDEPSVIGAGGGLSPMPNVDDLSIVLDFVTEEAGLTVEMEADPDQRYHAERALAAANRLRGIVAAPTGSEAREMTTDDQITENLRRSSTAVLTPELKALAQQMWNRVMDTRGAVEQGETIEWIEGELVALTDRGHVLTEVFAAYNSIPKGTESPSEIGVLLDTISRGQNLLRKLEGDGR